ncbi:MAG: tetratricopeptide repeat protein [Elusimicrobiota bacterium]
MAISKKQAIELLKENAESYSREEMRESLIASGFEPAQADALIAEATAGKAWLRRRLLKRILTSLCVIAASVVIFTTYRLKLKDRPDLLRDARAAARLGDHAGALPFFDSHIQSYPGDDYAYLNRGASHLALKNYESAIADFKQALFLKPRDTTALGGLILTYERRGAERTLEKDYSGALQDYEQVLSLDPANTLAMSGKTINLGLLDRRDGSSRPETSQHSPIILK